MIATAFAKVSHCFVGRPDLAYTLACRQYGMTVLMPADTTFILPGLIIVSSLIHKSRHTDQIVFLSGSKNGSFDMISIIFSTSILFIFIIFFY